MAHPPVLRAIAGLSLLFLARLPATAQDTQTEQQFRKGVAPAAERISQVSGRGTVKKVSRHAAISPALADQFQKAGIDPPEAEITEFRWALHGRRTLRIDSDVSGIDTIEGLNEKYAFVLRRRSDSGAATVQQLEQIATDPQVQGEITQREIWVRASVFGTFHVWSVPLYELVESSDFQLHSVSANESDDGAQHVRVAFDFVTREPDGSPDTTYTDCYVVCDPQYSWAIREYGGTLHTHVNDYRATHHVTVEWGDIIQDIPIAKTIRHLMRPVGDPGTELESVFSIDLVSEEVPVEEFYLSYYGLDEPTFQAPWYTSGWVLLVIGCVFTAVGAGLLRSRRNRR